jgi:hypothetical protein
MTIPGRGDLSPRRHYGYGRRRRRWPRVLLVLVILAGLGAGGYYGWHRWRDDGNATVALSPCATATPTPTASAPPPITAKVLNGSLKPGLAARVAKQLHQRFGVVVARVGNAARFTRGASVVRYPVRLAGPARALAGWVTPAARLRADAKARKVELDLGTRFRAVLPAPVAKVPTPAASRSPCLSP